MSLGLYPRKVLFSAMLAILVLLPFRGNSCDVITISGQVTSTPHQMHPLTDVTAYCAISGEFLAHATTDQDGYYLLEIYFTSVSEIDLFDLKVYPNPFAGRADVLFTTGLSGEYILECVAVDGSIIMSQSKTLAANQRVRAQIENPGRTGIYYLVIHSPQVGRR